MLENKQSLKGVGEKGVVQRGLGVLKATLEALHIVRRCRFAAFYIREF